MYSCVYVCNFLDKGDTLSLLVQILLERVCVYIMWVCVCFLPIYSGHKVRWTYQPRSHRIFHLPSFCGACLNFSREKDSAIPFSRRP